MANQFDMAISQFTLNTSQQNEMLFLLCPLATCVTHPALPINSVAKSYLAHKQSSTLTTLDMFSNCNFAVFFNSTELLELVNALPHVGGLLHNDN
jgi:hypothetical protein